ncbi:exocyst complex component EXO84B-like [Humulus lupulus]|uniref:exocyst complex component EXO84B-like n=1 Tax=Humulus lupulus TaxID=3486 RepID=UPI002B40EB87|nr:exocyst complex component EXO84B-like [Humulus lupulus]
MELAFSTSSSRFRFRDHSSATDSDVSSISSDGDDEPDLASMTGQGIKHLCSELLELKLASNEEFNKNIFSNYSVFIRIFEEAKHLGTELEELKDNISIQKRLIKELVDLTCSKVLVSEVMDPLLELDYVSPEPVSPPSELEDHINNISEILDVLLLEKKLDEAIEIIEIEEESFRNMKFEESFPLNELGLLYDSMISERKVALSLQLTLLAENPRITAPELRKALLGLCRLGEGHLANELMLRYYHARIETGIHSLQCSKYFSSELYIRQLAKLVFSLISQGARGFVMLNGETMPYTTDLIQWSLEETKLYIDCFNQYIESILEVSGGLSTTVEAVQVSVMFCSLLDTQRLMLLPFLINHIRPSLEDALLSQFEHFKEVINIFTTVDSWDLGRYLVSEIMNEECSSTILGEEPEYCLLTSSGWKFLTLVQTIAEDVTPLVALQMEDSIFSGLMNLFNGYVVILERALIHEKDVIEKGVPIMNFAVSLQQQISILANLSALQILFPKMVRAINEGIHPFNTDDMNELTISSQETGHDRFTLFTQEASNQLRTQFCHQFIQRIMSCEISHNKLLVENSSDGTPSVTFQVLFLQLRNLERLAEDTVFEKEWLLDLLRELVEITFIHISTKTEMWAISEETSTAENSVDYKQLVLDFAFLAEISKHGGYFSSKPSALADLMKSAYLSIGLTPERDVNENDYELDSTNDVMKELIEIEKTSLIIPNEESTSIVREETNEDQPKLADNSTDSSPRLGPEATLGDFLKVTSFSSDIRSTKINLEEPSTSSGIIECENLIYESHETKVSTKKYNSPNLPLSVDAVEEGDTNHLSKEFPSI